MTAEIIQFLPRAALDQDRLVREARAQYQAIFPDELAFKAVVQSSELLYTPEDTAPCEYCPDNLA